MELSKYQIFIAIGLFVVLSFVIIKLSYQHFKNKSSAKEWKIGGGRSGYFRLTLLVSVLLTGLIMLILSNTILN